VGWAENRNVRWSAGAALISVLIVIAFWFLLIEPRRTTTSDLGAQEIATQQGNDALRTRIEELRVQYGKLPEQRAKLDEIRRQLPATVEMSTLLRTVDALASSSGVSLSSFSPGEPAPLAAAGGAAPAGAAAPAGQAAGIAKATGGLYSIPLTLVVSGDYFQSVAFLRQLQTGMPRAMLISGLQIGKGSGTGDQVQVTISGQVFTRTDAPATSAAGKSTTTGAAASNLGATPGATAAATPAATPGATPVATPAATPGATAGTTAPSSTTAGASALAGGSFPSTADQHRRTTW
jgi:hypothetical protein